MSDHDMESARATARSLAERIRSDALFRKQIQTDPVRALTAGGLPREFVTAFLQETQLSEVAGYGVEQQVCLISDVSFIQDFIH